MRELERIDRICKLLKEKWKNVPDQNELTPYFKENSPQRPRIYNF